MATENQKRVFSNVMDKVRKGQKIAISKEMQKVGYSFNTSQKPGKVTKSKGWAELLAEIEDQPLLDQLKKIALDKDDKRACLQGIDILLKLKDRYPAGKLKIGAYEERDRVVE